MSLLRQTLRLKTFCPRLFAAAFVHSSTTKPLLKAPQTKDQTASVKRPKWVQQIFDDKRTYFDSVSDVERCFLTNLKQNDSRKCFSLSFDNAPGDRRIDVSFLALRETCRCEKCFSHSAQSKQNNIYNLDTENHPREVEFDQGNQLLHVTWANDGHESTYSGPWLYATFTKHPLYEGPEKKFWTAGEYMKNSQAFDFKKICTNSEARLKFIQSLCTWGLVKIQRAPLEKDALAELARNVIYVRQSHYGKYFQVENKPTPSNLAYNHDAIQPHVDQPWFHYQPGIQFLHCIRQSKQGGDNGFADCFAVAEYLRKHEKATFDALTQIPYIAYNYAQDAYSGLLMYKRTAIYLSRAGSYKQLHVNDHGMDSLRQLSPEKQDALLKAIKRFFHLLQSPQFCAKFKLSEGEIAVVDNLRVTHARDGFGSSESRLLIGCYIDWDEMHACRRLLQCDLFQKKMAEKWPSFS